jgi:thiosulfate/3-mercaptopyruvate sulfurtransferase
MAAFFRLRRSKFIPASLAAILGIFAALAIFAAAQPASKSTDDLPPNSPQVIQPAELAQAMKSAQKPVILYVGPKSLYAQAHIAGAEYIGPVAKADTMEKLRARAASLSKSEAVVIYCGCCPWTACPNIRPAYAELKKEGFTRVRVLYLATSFGADWKDKGLPVASGE